jgi:hypothetical protein
MSMAVDETRNDSLSLQVYDLRRRPCQFSDVQTHTNSAKFSIPDSERFSNTELLVYSYDFAIDEYRIGESRRKYVRYWTNSAGKKQDAFKNNLSPHFYRGHKSVPVDPTEKRGQLISATGSRKTMVSLKMRHHTLCTQKPLDRL